jgi:hypothetical protein
VRETRPKVERPRTRRKRGGWSIKFYRTLAKMMSEGKNNILARSWERRGTGTVVPRVAACVLSFSSPAILKRPRGDQAVV